MTLALRYLYTILTSLLRSRMGVLEESRVAMRVWPWELDFNLHLNNGRYLSLMDLGRVDLLVRSGIGRLVLAQRWLPVLGGATMRFRRPLGPLQAFDLVTRLVGWDEKWIYLEQRFEAEGKVAAQGYVQALFLGPRGKVPTHGLLEALGHSAADSPELPPGAQALRTSGVAEAL